MSDEHWVPVFHFPEYEVSDLGHVRCLVPRNNRPAPRLLSQTLFNNKYVYVNLRGAYGNVMWGVHRVVCEAFHGERPSSRHQAAHFDGDRLNNIPSNLRWATAEENCADKVRHGTQCMGSDMSWAVLTEDQIPVIRRFLRMHVPGNIIAQAFLVSRYTISLINKDKIWKHVPHDRDPSETGQ